jgi:DNA-directed RNA polymerase subunit RPC12/RpoP
MDYECIICSEPLEKEDYKPASLPCGHTFHKIW